MSDTVRLYGCGCFEGSEGFETCRKARRLEDRMHDAELTVQGCASNASWLAQYPLTYDDPEYFEHGRSVMDHADKLSRVAVELEHLYYREVAARKRASRAHRSISHHISVQTARGEYRDELLEDPPEPDFDQADL
ncbi:hypothetical protein [Rubrobacter aplysinae]|uniref:hypothetical protein n=1 Tax=Rubrobacter aplysinae TaxID=909625 RepID=UPI00064C2D6C|nr:hypothetical protein [Rubrobacter aplysinae]